MVQLLAGLITYLVLTIYCHKNYYEKDSIKHVRQLRILIQNQAPNSNTGSPEKDFDNQSFCTTSYAKTQPGITDKKLLTQVKNF